MWVPARSNELSNNDRGPSRRIDNAQRQVDNDENVNGRRGTFKTKRACPGIQEPGTSKNNSPIHDRERVCAKYFNKLS